MTTSASWVSLQASLSSRQADKPTHTIYVLSRPTTWPGDHAILVSFLHVHCFSYKALMHTPDPGEHSALTSPSPPLPSHTTHRLDTPTTRAPPIAKHALHGTEKTLLSPPLAALLTPAMSAATASVPPSSSSHPTPHSNASSSSYPGPSSTTEHAHHAHGSSRVHKPFQPHVLFRWTRPGEAVSVVGSWNG